VVSVGAASEATTKELPEVLASNAHLTCYLNVLQDCHHCYLQQRQHLLVPTVTDAVGQLVRQYRADHCALVRGGVAFFAQVCEDETGLYGQFFGTHSPLLTAFLEELCVMLYDCLRPVIIHLEHLETLADLCGIQRSGVLEHLQSSPLPLAPLRAVVSRLHQDTQERLVYRASVYVASDIAGYQPSPGCLAYPQKLQLMEQIAQQIATQRKASRSDSVASSDVGGGRFSRVGSSAAELHGMWYPTVRRTLLCLSRLYRCVDTHIFQGVSSEAVHACVSSLAAAAALITAGPRHADLFTIKHLLILREQLAPFTVECGITETSLDWSGLRGAAYELVQRRAAIFSLSSNNALLQFIVDTPQVTQSVMDSKRDVDNELKTVCEQLIQLNTNT